MANNELHPYGLQVLSLCGRGHTEMSITLRCVNSSSNSNEHAKQHRPSAM